MIVVKVELWSAVDGSKQELARMSIDNIGCSANMQVGDYRTRTMRGRSTAQLDRWQVQREGKVVGHRRLALHVWNLVAKALVGLGYGQESQP
jgi:hypothetical protein